MGLFKKAKPDVYAGPDPDDWTLEDEAAVWPKNLSHAKWSELAAQRGVPLDQVSEYTALHPGDRPDL